MERNQRRRAALDNVETVKLPRGRRVARSRRNKPESVGGRRSRSERLWVSERARARRHVLREAREADDALACALSSAALSERDELDARARDSAHDDVRTAIRNATRSDLPTMRTARGKQLWRL